MKAHYIIISVLMLEGKIATDSLCTIIMQLQNVLNHIDRSSFVYYFVVFCFVLWFLYKCLQGEETIAPLLYSETPLKGHP